MSFELLPQSTAPPSRIANPFATCWTNPGSIPFHFSDSEAAENLIAKLAAQRWRGAILGPHGSGKSTLLETLKPALRAAGRKVYAITLHNGQRRLPRSFINDCMSGPNSFAIIDGYEQLAWPARFSLGLCLRMTDLGLLVTSHASIRIPKLIELVPTRELIEQLVAELCTNVPTRITPADVAASYACHGSNVREIFCDLYDRFEWRRRNANLSPVAT